MASRTALLIRCSKQEAAAIRAQAQAERRTISHFVLNIVLRAVESEETIEGMWVSNSDYRERSRSFHRDRQRKIGPRTAILVRCSTQDGDRIRAAARRKNTMISDYVLHCVRRGFSDSLSGGPELGVSMPR